MTLHKTTFKCLGNPVCIGHPVPIFVNRVLRDQTVCRHVINVLLRIHYFRSTTQVLRHQLYIVSDAAHALLGLAGGNQDNTVTGLCTVDGSRSSIFQHLHALNVIGVDVADVLRAEAVHYIQRVAATVATVTTDTDGSR